jgi:hypothetical protein
MARFLTTAVLAAGLVLSASWLTAQQGAPSRVPVTLVLVDRLTQSDAPFVIERRPDLTPRDVIVMRADATPDQLSDAVRSLITIRQAGGDTAAARGTMRVRPQNVWAGGARHPTARRALPWAARVLGDLQRAAARDIAGIGRVRAVEIWLPAQARGRR